MFFYEPPAKLRTFVGRSKDTAICIAGQFNAGEQCDDRFACDQLGDRVWMGA